MSAEKSNAKDAKEGEATAEDILSEYEGLRAQSEALRESLNLINSSIADLSIVRQSLTMIGEMTEDNEILVPMGGDSFARARITDRERVIVGMGSNVAVGKSISEALEDLEKRVEELEKLRDERTAGLQRSLRRMEELSPMVQTILSTLTKEG
ncbi:MAG: prefoldin subunit alpha [Candidatus Hydrothermarchaeaceae archaeon]